MKRYRKPIKPTLFIVIGDNWGAAYSVEHKALEDAHKHRPSVMVSWIGDLTDSCSGYKMLRREELK